jgi:uncharacterized integral membrane protein (TIGR00697 family)
MVFLLSFLPHGLSGEVLLLVTALVCFCAILLLFRFFGRDGAVAYIVLGSVVSNLQVLKTAVLQVTSQPVVLGTVVFTSLFWAMELVSEHEGPRVARTTLKLSFWAPLLVMVWMGITIAHEPVLSLKNLEVHKALEVLFHPAPALFIAGIFAYFISQWFGIWLFTVLKTRFSDAYLGSRAICVILVAGFLDNVLFSILAWKIFAIQNITWGELFWTYIVGASGLRALLSLGAGPLLYCARHFSPPKVVTPTRSLDDGPDDLYTH